MLYYIGYYSDVKNTENTENRKIYLSAVNKMEYIINVLERNKIDSMIISCSRTMDKRGYPGSFKNISKYTSIKEFRTFGTINIITKIIDLVSLQLNLYIYLLANVKSTDTLLAYHSLSYCRLIRFVRRFKKCKLILEVEELYSDVNHNRQHRRLEFLTCKSADAFIFPTSLLNNVVNQRSKPFILIHGTYQVELDRRCKSHDGRIHIVYAGTFDPRKGGATAAAAAAEFLDERYHMHIIGFGNKSDTDSLLEVIKTVSLKTKCKLTYDGLLSGEEYIRFIQSCDIGLSTQNPDAAFNATSFPSKILSYLANGLRVVSIRIPAVEMSDVGDLVTYYEEQTPEKIANAIRNVDISLPNNCRQRIRDLDSRFKIDMQQLLLDVLK